MNSGRRTISSGQAPWSERIRELVDSRDLFLLLLRRELQVRYKQTALGVIWVVLQPLVPAIIFAVVLGTFARLPSADTPYILFALSGLILYGLFSGIVTRSSNSLLKDAQLVTKVYFPRSILPLAGGSAAIVDFAVGSAVLGGLMVVLGYPPSASIVFALIVVALTILLAFGVGLAVAALSAHYRDFAYAVPFMVQVLLYASPVVYSSELIPGSARPLLALNPFAPLVDGFRWALLGTPPPEMGQIVIGSIVGITVVICGLFIFERMSRDLTDVI